MKKRILSLVLAIAMFTTAVMPISAQNAPQQKAEQDAVLELDGRTNLARQEGCLYTASSEYPDVPCKVTYAFDGLKSAAEYSAYQIWATKDDDQDAWIQIQFPQETTFDVVKLYDCTVVDHAFRTRGCEIQISEDGTSWNTVGTYAAPDRPANDTVDPVIVLEKPSTATYLRIAEITSGDVKNPHYVEVEVYNSQETVEAASVTLNQTSVTLAPAETAALQATVLPKAADQTVTWGSDNEAVATVADGVVTAVAEGTATIQAAAGKVTATCTVTVSSQEPEPEPENKRSVDAEDYVPGETTAVVTAAANAADMHSCTIQAEAGQQVVFDNVDFTGAKRLMMVANTMGENAGKKIDVYVDTVSEANKLGQLTAKDCVSALDFKELYLDFAGSFDGTHKVIFSFPEAMELELDWFITSAYTGKLNADQDEHMAWWRDARFGQFIHFGAYSYLGGEYEGRQTGYAEWIMKNLGISKEDYAEKVAKQFNPTEFDAAEIVATAKAAGQKYIVVTTRHHEGFSMYDTQIRDFKDYKLVGDGKYGSYEGEDPIKALSEECKKQGIIFGTYITIYDWHDHTQSSYGDNLTGNAAESRADYTARLKAQCKELIEKYDTDLLWFDGSWTWWDDDAEECQALYDYLRTIKPSVITNNRLGVQRPVQKPGDPGDYGTPEQSILEGGVDADWESCMTLNSTWGYNKYDNNWKNEQTVIYNLVDCASKGGNYLLNVGPDGNGNVPERSTEILRNVGKWLETNGESIYGTRKSCYSSALSNGVKATVKEGALYLNLLDKDPASIGLLEVPALKNTITGVEVLGVPGQLSYTMAGNLMIDVSNVPQQQYGTVIKVSVEGTPEAEETVEVQYPNLAAGLDKSAYTASSYYTDHDLNCEPAWAFDGDKSDTAFREYQLWSATDDDQQRWIQVDFGKATKFDMLRIYDNSPIFEPRTQSFEVQVSDDGETFKTVQTCSVQRASSTMEPLTLTLDQSVTARYLRLANLKTADERNMHIGELEVYNTESGNFVKLSTDISSFTLPAEISGTCGGGDALTLTVFATGMSGMRTFDAEIHEDGTWTAYLDIDDVAEREIMITANLKKDGQTIVTKAFQGWVEGTTVVEPPVNLAPKATATAVDSHGSGNYNPERVNDGVYGGDNRWTTNDGAQLPIWVQLKWDEPQTFNTVILTEWQTSHRCAAFQLQISEDGTNWVTVHTGTTIGQKLKVQLPEIESQYLRLLITDESKFHVCVQEIEVYNDPENETEAKQWLQSVTLTGAEAPSPGDVLTAAVMPEGATVEYVWTVNGETVGTDASYTVRQADIDHTIAVSVTGTGEYGGMVTAESGVVTSAQDTRILSFRMRNVDGTVDVDKGTILVKMDAMDDLSSVTPEIVVADGATISPEGPQDFSNPEKPVVYTVTAKDGKTTKAYTVTIQKVGYVTDEDLTDGDTAAPAVWQAAPSPNQYDYMRQELAAFCHFGMNTFTGSEWGSGQESPSQFTLEDPIDADGYVKTLKDAGFKKLIITAKHHDGFCIWRSQYTDHDLESTNYEGDVLAELSAACTKYGLDMGLYLSPWDVNAPSYGYRDENGNPCDPADDVLDYNEYYNNQLIEILGNDKYGRDGHFVEIWMDGAKGSGSYAQEYDFDLWFDTIQKYEGKLEGKYEDDALQFGSGVYTTVRWIGNESGVANEETWAKVQREYDETGKPISLNQGPDVNYKGVNCSVGVKEGNFWSVPEVDARITSGWFWGASKATPKTLENLRDMYLDSVGHNSVLLLNIPLNNQGKLDTAIEQRTREFGENLQQTFQTNLAAEEGVTIYASSVRGDDKTYSPALVTDGKDDTYWAAAEGEKSADLIIDLGKTTNFDVVTIEEEILSGQRIERFEIFYRNGDGAWQTFASGTTVGAKRVVLEKPVQADQVKIHLEGMTTDGVNAEPVISEVGIYKASTGFQIGSATPVGMEELDSASAAFKAEGWETVNDRTCIGNSCLSSSEAGKSLTIDFTGTRAWLMGGTGSGSAVVKVSVDDGAPVEVTLSAGRSQVAYETEDLSDGAHTMTVEVVSGTPCIDALLSLNNGGVGMLDFEAASYTVEEDSTLEVKVVRKGGSNGTLSALVQDNPGSAVQSSYYPTEGIEVVFADGETEKTVTVRTKRYTEKTGPLSFTLEIVPEVGQTGLVVGFTSPALVTINDAESYDADYLKDVLADLEPEYYILTAEQKAQFDAFHTRGDALLSQSEIRPEDVVQLCVEIRTYLAQQGDALRPRVLYTTDDPFVLPNVPGEAGEKTLEAEFFTLHKSGPEPIRVYDDSSRSHGQAVSWFEHDNAMTLPFYAAAPGVYTFTMSYMSGALASQPNSMVWSGTNVEPGTKDVPPTSYDNWISFDVTITKAGAGELRFDSGKYKSPNIDVFKVTAKELEGYTAVESVTLDQETAELKIGDTLTLKATIAPADATNQTMTWTSSDDTVAAVENGVVTAKKAGTAIITVTTADGGKTDSCTVTVLEDDSSTTTRYTITVKQTEGGKISPATCRVERGDDKTFTITANEGYEIADVLVDGKSVGAVSTYTFENVKSAHTITAKFTTDIDEGDTPLAGVPFTDVKAGDWFAEAVKYVVDNKLMNGVAEDKFAPNSATTRGMIVTILYREAGSPKVESDDVAWWSDARVWAMEQKISDGTNMEGTITREQLAAMLYRYAGEPKVTEEITGFSDVDSISDWASDAMKWAVAEGILNGSDGKLNPQGSATRAQVAAMLMRYLEKNG